MILWQSTLSSHASWQALRVGSLPGELLMYFSPALVSHTPLSLIFCHVCSVVIIHSGGSIAHEEGPRQTKCTRTIFQRAEGQQCELGSCACTLTALQAVGALRPRASDGPWIIGAIRAKRFTRCNSSSCRCRRDDNIVCIKRHDVNRRFILRVGYTVYPFLSTHRIRSIHRTGATCICSPMACRSFGTS